jgi:predicted metal-dependent hydrolase
MTGAGTLRLTVPRGASIEGGVRFAEGQASWIAEEWERAATERAPWRAGTMVWYRGERRPIESDGAALVLGPVRVADDTSVRPRIEAALRRLAADELRARAEELTRRTERRVARISIRNQRSRWGACSSRGVITLNWRLIQMPPEVADYVILHELAHLAHPNHSRRFWREVEALCPWWRDSERWLRQHARELL